MANYYLDFVGLNTFIYEPCGYDPENQFGIISNKNSTEDLTIYGVLSSDFATLEKNVIGILDSQTQNGFKVPDSIRTYKNHKFSHELPNTASFFPALMMHRNGPYGHPSWKQIRVGQNPLTRKQRSKSIFTYVVEPGEHVKYSKFSFRKKYGNIKCFTEPHVVCKYKPAVLKGGSVVVEDRSCTNVEERWAIKYTFANNITHFSNLELDHYYGVVDCGENQYDKIKDMYLNGGLNSSDTPMDIFDGLAYSEIVYPPEKYTGLNYRRQRTNFVFNWRDIRKKRTETDIYNGFGTTVLSQSMWPLDIGQGLYTDSVAAGRICNKVLWTTSMDLKSQNVDPGILQNRYSLGVTDLPTYLDNCTINDYLAPAPIYNRKHYTSVITSSVSPSGMNIETVNSGTITAELTAPQTAHQLPRGEAYWEAGAQAGKNPFYDTYEDFIQGVRQKGQCKGIVPEFRISNHVEQYYLKGISQEIGRLFEMTGGLLTACNSDHDDFYKIYSNSDFMKHFDLIRDDHREFAGPFRIKLKCKALKKFIPYNGFYPCQRTVDMAKQFYVCYSNHCVYTTSSTDAFYQATPTQNYSGGNDSVPDYPSVPTQTFEYGVQQDCAIKHGFQNVMGPLFAPGVLFNSIKSGIACDYPVITGSISISNGRILLRENDNSVPNYYLGTSSVHGYLFEKRVPFDALVEPEKYLSNYPLVCNEPHPSGNTQAIAVWNGLGCNYYKLMAHNFLAEVPEFFLQNKNNTVISSKASDDPNVGNATKGSVYRMRVKLYKSSLPSVSSITGSDGASAESQTIMPQYGPEARETFTMYSRPTAFGPPNIAEESLNVGVIASGSDSSKGENYAFTPPYYYGQGWADITFVAGETKKYTIEEIINQSTASYLRYVDPHGTGSGGLSTKSQAEIKLYNNDAMHVSASLNLFSIGDVSSDIIVGRGKQNINISIDASNESKSRWVIQSKFETPMMNFNHYSASNSITTPECGPTFTPRGMWHQYGDIEGDQSKGIFMQVTDVPSSWVQDVHSVDPDKSLIELCGFSTEAVRMGELSIAKTISEAVVAIPFVEEEGQRKFFKIPQATIDLILQARAIAEESVDETLIDMVDKIKKFVLPPNMDFVHNTLVDPFAMYIFEFKHTLTKQDLGDIWQNLPPSIGRSFEEVTSEISHGFLAEHMLSGAEAKKGQNVKGIPLPNRLKWMVFKAKQRAKTNYYEKIVGKKDLKIVSSAETGESFTQSELFDSTLRPEGFSSNISYNWPYDFFSMIELINIEAKAMLGEDGSEIENMTISIEGKKTDEIGEDCETTSASGGGIRGTSPPPVGNQNKRFRQRSTEQLPKLPNTPEIKRK